MRPAVVIVFHMRGCPHCVEVTGPQGACSKLKRVVVLEIESAHPLPSQVGVRSFPTLWLSTPTSVREYDGRERSPEALQKWVDLAAADDGGESAMVDEMSDLEE